MEKEENKSHFRYLSCCFFSFYHSIAYHLHLRRKQYRGFHSACLNLILMKHLHFLILLMKQYRLIILSVVMVFWVSVTSTCIFAQEEDMSYLEDEGSSLWGEQEFMDVTGREFETDNNQYVGEEEVKAAEKAAQRAGVPGMNLVNALEVEKEMMPDNIIYGVGTGAMIGGWIALTKGDDARTNVSYLTVGMLAGALIGFVIGSKSLLLSQGLEGSLGRETPLFAGQRGHNAFPGFKRQGLDPAPLARIEYRVEF